MSSWEPSSRRKQTAGRRNRAKESERASNQRPRGGRLTFGRQRERGLVDGERVRARGGSLLVRREAGGPALEHTWAPGVPDGGELQDAGPEQHRGGGGHQPELHPRPRGGGGREPELVAGRRRRRRLNLPPHGPWTKRKRSEKHLGRRERAKQAGEAPPGIKSAASSAHAANAATSKASLLPASLRHQQPRPGRRPATRRACRKLRTSPAPGRPPALLLRLAPRLYGTHLLLLLPSAPWTG